MKEGKIRELVCIDCGNYFLGKYAYVCPECRKERRKKAALEANKKKIGTFYGLEARVSAAKLNALLAKRKSAEKLLKPEICPNYDKTSVSCVMCPAGAFKFKACGREK